MLMLPRFCSLLLILQLIGYENGQLHLYLSSNGSAQFEYDHDCLDFYANDRISDYNSGKPYRKNHQIIPFCRRDSLADGLIVTRNNIPVFTLKELDERNVSSLDLYRWSASY